MKLIINGEERMVDKHTTIGQLLNSLNLQSDRVVLELNRQILEPAAVASSELHEGDHLEIIQFVGGG